MGPGGANSCSFQGKDRLSWLKQGKLYNEFAPETDPLAFSVHRAAVLSHQAVNDGQP